MAIDINKCCVKEGIVYIKDEGKPSGKHSVKGVHDTDGNKKKVQVYTSVKRTHRKLSGEEYRSIKDKMPL